MLPWPQEAETARPIQAELSPGQRQQTRQGPRDAAAAEREQTPAPGATAEPAGPPESERLHLCHSSAGGGGECCAICLDAPRDARPFPHPECPHAFCAECLENLHEHCRSGGGGVLCPVCRRPSDRPQAAQLGEAAAGAVPRPGEGLDIETQRAVVAASWQQPSAVIRARCCCCALVVIGITVGIILGWVTLLAFGVSVV